MGDEPDQSDEKRLMRRFFIIWSAQASSLVGSALVQFAIVWWLTLETGSATVLAFAMMMVMLPQIVIGPFAGALVDRWNRRHVMIYADGGIALATIALMALFASGLVEVWHIYVFAFIRSAGGAFHWPAMTASTSLMVPKKHLARVAGLNQAVQGAVSIAAPALGAILILVLPMWQVLSFDILTAAIAIAPLLFMKIPQPAPAPDGESGKRSVLGDMRDGLRFIRSWEGAMAILVMAMAINLLVAPAVSLIPMLVKFYFGGGVVEFAAIEVAFGLSLILGGIGLGIWGGFKSKVFTTLVSGALSGLGLILTGLAPPEAFYLALAGMFFAGLMSAIMNGSLLAVLQSSVPADKQGRVFGILGSLSVAAAPFGLAVAGPVSDLIGVHVWFVIAGLGLSVTMVVGFFIPSLTRMEHTVHGDVRVEEK